MKKSEIRIGVRYHAKIRGRVMQVIVSDSDGRSWWVAPDWPYDMADVRSETVRIWSQRTFLAPCCPQCMDGAGAIENREDGILWYRCKTCDHAFPVAGRTT